MTRKLTKLKKTREVKIEWTKQLVAQQKQKTERIKKETMLQNAKLDAQRVKDVRTTFCKIGRVEYMGIDIFLAKHLISPGESDSNARETRKGEDPV